MNLNGMAWHGLVISILCSVISKMDGWWWSDRSLFAFTFVPTVEWHAMRKVGGWMVEFTAH